MKKQTPKSKIEHIELLFKYICASCPWTPANILVKLASDPSISVRQRVAINSKTPRNILTMLAGDKNAKVRIGVCDNNSTPSALLYVLSCDENSGVRYAIAHNPSVPLRLLYLLAQDKNPYVANRASKTIGQNKPIDQLSIAS